MKAAGVDLAGLLGAPLYTDEEGQRHATWFDGVDLSAFISNDMCDLLGIEGKDVCAMRMIKIELMGDIAFESNIKLEEGYRCDVPCDKLGIPSLPSSRF